jgi:hypothetical protein
VGSARLTVSRALARRLALGRRRMVGTAPIRLTAAGERRVTIVLARRVRRAMKRRGVRRLTTSLRVTLADGEGQRTTRSATVRIRR